MGKKRDWSGKKQGKLSIIREIGRDKFGNVVWLCECDCGKETYKSNNALINGASACSRKCWASTAPHLKGTHGMHRSKEYSTWRGIKNRCFNKNNTAYQSYGGRGITMCREWEDSFEKFLEDVGRAPKSKSRVSLDRIDNNGNYEPGNVRWVNHRKQMNNRRVNVLTMFRGKLMTLGEISEITGEAYHRVYQRHRRGLHGEDLVRRHKTGRKPKGADQ